MWTSEDFPGADNVPWQLLIRARFAHQVDAVVASTVVRTMSHYADDRAADHIAKVALAAVERSRQVGQELSPEDRVLMLERVADWDGDICPPWWRWPWPPRPRRLEDINDPLVYEALSRVLTFAKAVGSDVLNESLRELEHEFQ